MNGTHPFPAPSLRELARPTGVTEGVSSDGSSVPTIYTPAHINSVIFERLRSSKYTPSVSHSLDSSLREGAGNGLCHSTGYSLTPGVTGDFHRPYETQNVGGRKSQKFFLTNGTSVDIIRKLISAVPRSFDHTWRHNSVGRVAGSYPVCHLFESDCRYQARWSSG